LGLSDDWVKAVQQCQPKRHVLIIRRLVANTDAAIKLKTGDTLLQIDGKIVTTFREVETETRSKAAVTLTILRNQQEISVEVATKTLSGKGTDRVVCWAGCILQDTHRAISQLGFLYAGVYCSRWFYGSPAHAFGLRAVNWIVEINGKPTPDLDAFLAAVKEVQQNTGFVRLKILGLQDKVSVITLKIESHYWPTWILCRTDDKWKLQQL